MSTHIARCSVRIDFPSWSRRRAASSKTTAQHYRRRSCRDRCFYSHWFGIAFCSIIFFNHATINAFFDNSTSAASRNRNDELPHSIRRAFAPVNLITLRPSPFSIFTLQPQQQQQHKLNHDEQQHNSSLLADMLATLGVNKVDTATFALNRINDSRPMLDAYTTHGINISLLHDVFMRANPAFPCASRLGAASFFTNLDPMRGKQQDGLAAKKLASSSPAAAQQQLIYRVANVDVFDSPKQLVQSVQQDLAERSQPMFVHNERLRTTSHADVERAEDGLHAVLGIASGFLWRIVGDECQVKRCVFLRVQVHVPLFELSLQRFGVLQSRFRQALKADEAGASLVDACQAGLVSTNAACSGGGATTTTRNNSNNKTQSRACRRASEQVCSHFDLQYFGTHFVPNSIWGGSIDVVYRWILDEKQPTRSEDDADFSDNGNFEATGRDGPLPATLYGTAVPIKAAKSPTSASDSAVVLMEVRNCLNDYLNYQLLATPYRLDPLLCYSRLWKLATRARIVHSEIEGGSYEAQATLRDCIAQALTFSSSCWYSFNEWLQTVFHAPAMLMWHERTTFAPMFNLLSEHEQLAACYMRRLELYSSQVRQLPARVPACTCPATSLPIFYFDFCYWLRRHASGGVENVPTADDEKSLTDGGDAATDMPWQIGAQQQAFTPQICLCACDIFDPTAGASKNQQQSSSDEPSSSARGARQAAAFASPPLPTSPISMLLPPSAVMSSKTEEIFKTRQPSASTTLLPHHQQAGIVQQGRYYNYYSHYKTLHAHLGTVNGGEDRHRGMIGGANGVCGTGQAAAAAAALSLATRSSITSSSSASRSREARRMQDDNNGGSSSSSRSSTATLVVGGVVASLLSYLLRQCVAASGDKHYL